MNRTRIERSIALLLVAALVGMLAWGVRTTALGSEVPEAGGDNPTELTPIFGGPAAGYAASDTIKSPVVRCFGAGMVVVTLKATTGACTLGVFQVSQDSTKWFATTQLGANPPVIQLSSAITDSLNKGPHTTILVPVGTTSAAGNHRIPYRYCRFWGRPYQGGPAALVTGFSLTQYPVYYESAEGYREIYNNSNP